MLVHRKVTAGAIDAPEHLGHPFGIALSAGTSRGTFLKAGQERANGRPLGVCALKKGLVPGWLWLPSS